MKAPRILILRAAGTNCDQETAAAFRMAGGEPVATTAFAESQMVEPHAALVMPIVSPRAMFGLVPSVTFNSLLEFHVQVGDVPQLLPAGRVRAAVQSVALP